MIFKAICLDQVLIAQYKYINIQLDIEIGEYNYCCHGENNVYLISHTFVIFCFLIKMGTIMFLLPRFTYCIKW